jgi:hypothetical protein
MQQIATFFGSSVLAIVGAGLISYGVYLIALARWRRMPV